MPLTQTVGIHSLPAPAATTSEGWFLVYGLKNSSNDTRAGLRRGTTRKVQVWIRIMPKSKVRGGPTVKRKPKGWYGLIEKKCFEQRRYLKHTWKKSIPGSGESQWKTIRWECAWIVQGLARRSLCLKGSKQGVEEWKIWEAKWWRHYLNGELLQDLEQSTRIAWTDGFKEVSLANCLSIACWEHE